MAFPPVVFMVTAVAWRLLLVFIFSSQITYTDPDNAIAPGFGFQAVDYYYHITPAENLYQNGHFRIHEDKPFAGRMPGYSAFYLFFRIWMSQEMASVMMIVTQALLGGLGAYTLARAAEMFFQRRSAFLIVFGLGILYPVSAFYDYQTLSEGLAISMTSVMLYCLMRGLRAAPVKWFLLAGALLAWIIFMRPYLGVLLPVMGLFLLWQVPGWINKFKYAIVFALPFGLALLAWNVRNYHEMGKVVIMEASVTESYGKAYSRAWMSIRSLIGAWGGEALYFEPASEAEWFRIGKSDKPLQLPERVYAAACFTPEDLQNLKRDFQEFHNAVGMDEEMQQHIVQTANSYRRCYVDQRSSFETWMIKANTIKRGTLRSGSSYMPPLASTTIDRLFRLKYLGMYYLLLGSVLLGAVFSRKGWFWILPAIALFIGVMKVTSIFEHRYFLTLMPFAIMGFTGFFYQTEKWLNRRGRINPGD